MSEQRPASAADGGRTVVAVVPVRGGELPSGGLEAVAEADGNCILIGAGVDAAATSLAGVGGVVHICEVGSFAPQAWALALLRSIEGYDTVILADNPDGRHLAPLLAHHLGRPLIVGADRVTSSFAIVARKDRRSERTITLDRPCVATLRIGSRTVEPQPGRDLAIETVALQLAAAVEDVIQLAELAPDPATMDLGEARRIIGGGAGLGGPARFVDLARVGAAIGASLGATRVATDAGWADHARQIGTTGVVVQPELYLAFGVSGAVQHVMGLGAPDHVVAVNLDPSCPMMAMADLAIVADAQAVVDELLARLGPDGFPARP